MTAKTHVSVGIASALLITHPKSIKELLLCLGVATVGSVISDIDVSTSEAYEAVNKIIKFALVATILLVFVDYNWSLGIITSFKSNSNIMRIIVGILIILGICIFGKNQPHRSFMHSILAVGLLSGAIYIALPEIVPCFAIAMSSHILIDTLNKKRVHIFYPLKGGVAFNLCKANGIVNNIIFKVASSLTIISLIYFAGKILVDFVNMSL